MVTKREEEELGKEGTCRGGIAITVGWLEGKEIVTQMNTI